MEKQKKGVRLEHISKIYNDPKTGKEFLCGTGYYTGY